MRAYGMPWSQLHWCAFRNDVHGIQKLTKNPGCCRRPIQPDKRDLAGVTPLHVACNHGQCHAVQALLDAGADATAVTKEVDIEGAGPSGGETALHWVVKLRYTPDEQLRVHDMRNEGHNGHTMAGRLLLKQGADANAKSKTTGRTALHGAIENGWDELVKVLLFEGGADANIPGVFSGSTAELGAWISDRSRCIA